MLKFMPIMTESSLFRIEVKKTGNDLVIATMGATIRAWCYWKNLGLGLDKEAYYILLQSCGAGGMRSSSQRLPLVVESCMYPSSQLNFKNQQSHRSIANVGSKRLDTC
jgi:hypothetical protein